MAEPTGPEPPPGAPRRRPDTILGTLRRFGRLWGFLAFLAFVVVLFRGIVLPFVFAILLAYLLSPLIRRLEAAPGLRSMPPRGARVLAVITSYVAIFSFLGVFFGLLLPAVIQDAARLRDTLPEAVQKLDTEVIPKVSSWAAETFGEFDAPAPEPPPTSELVVTPMGDGSYRVDLEGVRMTVSEQGDGTYLVGPPVEREADLGENLRNLVASQGAELTSLIGPWIQAVVAGVAGFLTSLVITFMLAAFIMVDLERVNRFMRSMVPYEYRDDFDELMKGMDRGLAGVIRGQLMICLVNGSLTYIGLVIIGIKYSFLLAVLAGTFSLIPIFGTILSSIPIVLIAVVSPEEGPALLPALLVMGWIALIHLIEANFLNPKIIGDQAHIHPVVVIFALLAGEHVYGLTGALLAVPAASMVQTAFLHARRRSDVFKGDSEVKQ